MLGKSNNFFADNWFGKIIIKENKEKVKPIANIILNKFLKGIVVLNIILLAKTREVIVKDSGITNYGNHHSVVNNTVDISKLI